MTPLHYSTIAETRELIRTKKISPAELVAAHLERAAALQPKLNAFVHLDAPAAREQARHAEQQVLRGDELRRCSRLAVSRRLAPEKKLCGLARRSAGGATESCGSDRARQHQHSGI